MLVYSAAWPHSAAGAHPTHAWMVVMVVVVQGEVMEGGSDFREGDLNCYFCIFLFSSLLRNISGDELII